MFNGIDWDNLDVSTWNTSNLTDIDNMFENSFITEIDMSNWDTSKIITNKNVFSNMKNLEFLKINKLPEVSKLIGNGIGRCFPAAGRAGGAGSEGFLRLGVCISC